jgi:kynurenine formamidase
MRVPLAAPLGPALALMVGLAAGCGESQKPAALAWSELGAPVDLTHPFDADAIYWPTEEGFVLEHGFAGTTERGFYYEAHRLRLAEHGGTHVDAPSHFHEGGDPVDRIPLSRLVGPAFVVDVREACARDPDHAVTVEELERFEARHGRLPESALVLLHTGFARHWSDRAAYLGTAARGPEATRALRFPGLSPEAAAWLVTQRRVAAVGIDTASIDPGRSLDFETHRILAAAGVPAFENLTNLERLPATGSVLVALPMKIRGGSGGPLRALAFVPR